jgi:hypothetical protein
MTRGPNFQHQPSDYKNDAPVAILIFSRFLGLALNSMSWKWNHLYSGGWKSQF